MTQEKTYHIPGDFRGQTAWRSPSNIAIVKYWGKKGYQLPISPSISMTLSRSFTETIVAYGASACPGGLSFEFLFEGNPNQAFAEKVEKYLQCLDEEMPFLKGLHLEIRSRNSFPHSAGIASSAASMSALALCLLSIEQALQGSTLHDAAFYQRASRLARMGSGSACRSVYPAWSLWGDSQGIRESSDLYAIDINKNIHPVFRDMQDSILIVDSGKKSVSSSQGHEMMNRHPFVQERIIQARENTRELIDVLHTGDMNSFMAIAEHEALTLHALMMSSKPGFVLTHPNTLKIIKKLYKFRDKTGARICFTLDAGPNLHLLYPMEEKPMVLEWLEAEVLELCEDRRWIDDALGSGPQLMTEETER
jgi:diphosphomevalonate decarboxylase